MVEGEVLGCRQAAGPAVAVGTSGVPADKAGRLRSRRRQAAILMQGRAGAVLAHMPFTGIPAGGWFIPGDFGTTRFMFQKMRSNI